jgi:hypothetical protein
MKQEPLAANQPFAPKKPGLGFPDPQHAEHTGITPRGNHVQPDRPSSPAEEQKAAR